MATITHTCDADSIAQAQYEVLTPAGPLLLCGHHYRANLPAFAALGYPAAILADITVPAYTRVYGTPGGMLIRLT